MKAGSIGLLSPRRATLHLAVAYGLSASYLRKGGVEVAEDSNGWFRFLSFS